MMNLDSEQLHHRLVCSGSLETEHSFARFSVVDSSFRSVQLQPLPLLRPTSTLLVSTDCYHLLHFDHHQTVEV